MDAQLGSIVHLRARLLRQGAQIALWVALGWLSVCTAAAQDLRLLAPRPVVPDSAAAVILIPPPTPDSLDAAPPERTIRPARLALIGGSAAVVAFAAMDTQRRRWWQDRSPHFRIMNDWEYVRWTDKIGHFFATASASRFYRGSLAWAGLPEREAEAYGALAGWTQLLYYEVLDGFGPQWGFSPGDLLFNTLGAGFAYAQWRIPELQAYELKVSYWPSGWEGKQVVDDYAGQTWWLTANLNQALPGRAGEVIPPWLNVAVGYGARHPDADDFLTTSEVYLGLDLELRGLPIDHPTWNAAVEWLRYLHLPAPAIRLTPRPTLVLFAY